MNDVKIIQYFDSRAVNLDYQAVRIRAVLYDNMEKFSDCESYACCLLQAYLKSENFWYAEL